MCTRRGHRGGGLLRGGGRRRRGHLDRGRLCIRVRGSLQAIITAQVQERVGTERSQNARHIGDASAVTTSRCERAEHLVEARSYLLLERAGWCTWAHRRDTACNVLVACAVRRNTATIEWGPLGVVVRHGARRETRVVAWNGTTQETDPQRGVIVAQDGKPILTGNVGEQP